MDINIYGKYRVVIESVSNYVDPESTRNDVGFVMNAGCSEHEMEGGELIEMISRELGDKWTDIVVFKNSMIYISQFNPTNGESSETKYHIMKLDEPAEWTSADIVKEED